MNGGDFFRPFWRRLAVVVAAGVWAAIEWAAGQAMWAMMATAVTVWGVWSFLINYQEPDKGGEPRQGGDGQ